MFSNCNCKAEVSNRDGFYGDMLLGFIMSNGHTNYSHIALTTPYLKSHLQFNFNT